MRSAPTPPAAIRLAPTDNVAVTVRRLEAGEIITVAGRSVAVTEALPLGHKVALAPIPAGGEIVKFGMPVGVATKPIDPGQWVHVHNVRSLYLDNDVNHHES